MQDDILTDANAEVWLIMLLTLQAKAIYAECPMTLLLLENVILWLGQATRFGIRIQWNSVG